MKIDIHTHYLPKESLKVAQEIGKRYDLKIAWDEKGREVMTRDGKRGFGPFRDEFHDLDLRLKIEAREKERIAGGNVAALLGIGI